MSTPAFTQQRFRLRNDDGTEVTATYKAAENASITQAVATALRARIQIDETAGVAWASITWNLRYSLNGGAYTLVSGSTPIQFALSANFADGANTTAQLTASTGTFTAANAAMKEATGGAVNSGTAGQYFEYEACLTIDETQVAHGDTIDLRIYNGSSAIAAYTQTPRITVNDPIEGVVTKTEGDDTPTATGALLIQGTATKTEANDTLATSGGPVVSAVLAATEAGDTLVAAGTVRIGAVLAATEAGDTLAGVAGVVVSAVLAATEATDLLVADGIVQQPAAGPVSAVLDATEADDTLAAVGGLQILAALDATEAVDVVAATATQRVAAAVSVVEGNDGTAGTANVVITGLLAQAEQADTLAAVFTIVAPGAFTLDATEQADTVAAAGTLAHTAAAAITEQGDTVAATGMVAQPSAPAIDTSVGSGYRPLRRQRTRQVSVDFVVALAPLPTRAALWVVEQDDGCTATVRSVSAKHRAAIALLLTT